MAAVSSLILISGLSFGQSLKEVPVPIPSNLADFVADETAAIRLGKALFWDMQVGSDGIQACASCHFHAGADHRVKNQVTPGLLGGDITFQVRGPNETLTRSDFPFRKLVDSHSRGLGGLDDANDPNLISDANDVVSSMGVHFTEFEHIRIGGSVDAGRLNKDRVFHQNRLTTRRVEPRNTPTVINAVFNAANFLDGRANHFFNGVNPFGHQDVDARILVVNQTTGLLEEQAVLLDNSSLASQAVGPPLSEFEMSFSGRTFAQLGRKMLSLMPLGKQLVHPDDSVLGPLSNASTTPGARGLNITYSDMIQAAFLPRYWSSGAVARIAISDEYYSVPDEEDPDGYMFRNGELTIIQNSAGRQAAIDDFTQMEANFSLFFGLAVQMYESTLVSDDTPFDRFVEGDPDALTDRQQRGMNRFQSGGANCIACHVGAEFTGASVAQTLNPLEPGLIEVMAMGDGGNANYDQGFYNIGVRPTSEDIGRGGTDPFGNPLSFSRQLGIKVGILPGSLTFDPGLVPDFGCTPAPSEIPPTICPPPGFVIPRFNVDGAFKTPGLRNVELTGPYFHNGGTLTLRQVVDFYVRGTDFHERNFDNLDPFLTGIGALVNNVPGVEEVVDFLLALTDERVRMEMAPFDHPQLFVPNGHSNQRRKHPKLSKRTPAPDELLEIPAVGVLGRAAEGLPPLKPFLADDLEGNALTDFHFQP